MTKETTPVAGVAELGSFQFLHNTKTYLYTHVQAFETNLRRVPEVRRLVSTSFYHDIRPGDHPEPEDPRNRLRRKTRD